jgi:anti-anti-sigma factor
MLWAAARATRERARETFAEDQTRRLCMRHLQGRAEQTSDKAGASWSRLRSGHRPAVRQSRAVSGGETHTPSTVSSSLCGDNPSLPTAQFGLRSEAPAPSQAVLRVTGEIDIASAPALGEALQFRAQTAEPRTDLIADLTAVTFIDARGLAALLEAADTARSCGLAFRVTGRLPCILRLLELTGTRGALDIE